MIAISGASGRLGGEVARALAGDFPALAVRLGTRNPDRIVAAGPNHSLQFADFDDPASMQALFDGADVALIICSTADNDRRIRQHRDAVDAAKAAGVGHLVYTSFVNPSPNSLFPMAAAHADTESYAAASRLSCSFVRNNHYFDNLRMALNSARQTGRLSLPGASGKVAYLAIADIGAALARILSLGRNAHPIYELTGAEALDLHDIAAQATAIWERPVVAEEMPQAAFGRLLAESGLSGFAVTAQTGIRLACGAGEYAGITNDVAELTGREPARIASFLAQFNAPGGVMRDTRAMDATP